MTYSVKIPIKPWLRRFVMHQEMLSDGDPLPVLRLTPITTFLFILFVNKQAISREGRFKVKLSDEYSETLIVRVPANMVKRNRIFLPKPAVVAVNTFLHHLFYAVLIERIRVGTALGKTKLEVVQAFLDELGIDEDMLSLDAVLKEIQRQKKKRATLETRRRRIANPYVWPDEIPGFYNYST